MSCNRSLNMWVYKLCCNHSDMCNGDRMVYEAPVQQLIEAYRNRYKRAQPAGKEASPVITIVIIISSVGVVVLLLSAAFLVVMKFTKYLSKLPHGHGTHIDTGHGYAQAHYMSHPGNAVVVTQYGHTQPAADTHARAHVCEAARDHVHDPGRTNEYNAGRTNVYDSAHMQDALLGEESAPTMQVCSTISAGSVQTGMTGLTGSTAGCEMTAASEGVRAPGGRDTGSPARSFPPANPEGLVLTQDFSFSGSGSGMLPCYRHNIYTFGDCTLTLRIVWGT